MLRKLLVVGILAFSVSAMADPLVVTGQTDAMTLAQALAGAGITVDSATLIGQSDSTATQQGTFTGGTAIIPFDSGVLLTSGNALGAPGPNNTPSYSKSWNTTGDAQLSALAGVPTHDANVLTFSFHKSGPTAPDVVSFQYVFGSEEYNEYVGSSFNDAFGFFLNGTNIALVPGTSTPVAINNVNCGSNSAFYNSNDPFNSNTGGCNGTFTNLNTQYDGLAGGLGSLPLFATGALMSGENTISLKIADASDTIYDSAVFLKGNSFIAGPPPSGVPEPSSIVMLGSVFLISGLLLKNRSRRA